MKKTLLLFTFVFGLSYSAFAGACVNSTLAIYDASGFSCTIGNITFSDFGYIGSGTNPVDASQVGVTPETIGGETGFQFNAPWVAAPGETTDGFISFSAACNGCQFNDLVLQEAGAGAGPGGIVNITENSSALPGSLIVGAIPGTTILSDSATFSPVGSLSVTKDVGVRGGTGGLGSGVSSVTNLLSETSTVPEPSLGILCTGLLGLVPIARRKFVR
jgi:hypothetical protein